MKFKFLKIFIVIVAFFLFSFFAYKNSSFCNVGEIFNDELYNNPSKECRAILVKRADNGDYYAENRLRYPNDSYLQELCKNGINNLEIREKYYLLKYNKKNAFCIFDETTKDKK